MAQRRSRISGELLDELLAGEDPREAFRSGDLLLELQKSLAERALGAEMEVHLSGEGEVSSGNHRNGHNRKRVLTGTGSMEVAVPRARAGTSRRSTRTGTRWRQQPGTAFPQGSVASWARVGCDPEHETNGVQAVGAEPVGSSRSRRGSATRRGDRPL